MLRCTGWCAWLALDESKANETGWPENLGVADTPNQNQMAGFCLEARRRSRDKHPNPRHWGFPLGGPRVTGVTPSGSRSPGGREGAPDNARSCDLRPPRHHTCGRVTDTFITVISFWQSTLVCLDSRPSKTQGMETTSTGMQMCGPLAGVIFPIFSGVFVT